MIPWQPGYNTLQGSEELELEMVQTSKWQYFLENAKFYVVTWYPVVNVRLNMTREWTDWRSNWPTLPELTRTQSLCSSVPVKESLVATMTVHSSSGSIPSSSRTCESWWSGKSLTILTKKKLGRCGEKTFQLKSYFQILKYLEKVW